MAKVEIDFPSDFESKSVGPIQLGRFIVGDSIARFYLTPQGKTMLLVPKSALTNGDIQTWDDTPDVQIHGFGKE